jgi:hypothetical protein
MFERVGRTIERNWYYASLGNVSKYD